jgi:hypothetical protein
MDGLSRFAARGRHVKRKDNLLLASRPPGYARIASFLDSIDSGAIPLHQDVQWLAERLEKIFDAPPARVPALLELKRGRGERGGANMMEHLEKWVPILSFVDKSIAADAKPRGATTRALAAAANKFGKEKTVIEKQWRGFWKSEQVAGKHAAEDIALITTYLSPEEIEAMCERPVRDLIRLARDRQTKTTAKK